MDFKTKVLLTLETSHRYRDKKIKCICKMSLVTFAAQGLTLTIEAPSVSLRPQFNSPQMADNSSNHLLCLQDVSSPCSFSTQARQCTATVQHFSEAGSFSEQNRADPLGRIYLFISSSAFLKSSQTLKDRTLAYCWC